MGDRTETARLRADALRNRELILTAAGKVFLEHGVDAPLDRIAARAGVGNATLYRHFPSRSELIKYVAIDSMERLRTQAHHALAEPDGAWAGLVLFCQTVVEQRLIASFPILAPHVRPDAEFDTSRDALESALGALIVAAQQTRDLRNDIDAGDMIMILATITRPLPGLTAELTTAAQSRHLSVVLTGLHARGAVELPGAPITATDIATSLAVNRSAG